MPELPEVETIRRGLMGKIVGKTIAEVEVRVPKLFQGDRALVQGHQVKKISRRAKILAIGLDNGYNLLFHLKMTGQLIYIDRNNERFAGGHPDHNWHAKLPNSTTAIVFNFGDQTHLYFNDLRKFGWCKVLTDVQLEEIFRDSYGPEPIDIVDNLVGKTDEFTVEYLLSWAKKIPNRSIKQFLLDQKIIAGIGNIYADEAVFLAGIMPTRKVKEISPEEWQKLVECVKMVLENGVKYGGTTDSDYVNADGKKGGMQDYLNVYHREDLPCTNNCGGVIKRMTVGGRGTHYCENCQK